jgi:hypothetical protein
VVFCWNWNWNWGLSNLYWELGVYVFGMGIYMEPSLLFTILRYIYEYYDTDFGYVRVVVMR